MIFIMFSLFKLNLNSGMPINFVYHGKYNPHYDIRLIYAVHDNLNI